ncbi:alpha/beta hydrolase [Alkalihalobacillus sp. LMS6]|uniref:alpha/beta hydrolase n=1 Tax=Alkalihalobacillus sp. LMS6 TaxID=2924034 RepID=UPI0020D0AE0A|nr:alpha/beta hydrolase [Alkalihalobacillus sp. LMS6]UTR08253.1 alpha/beta hydrolase [Alkalihalobacillus sp. LMS6]UTR08320.1 alpha/beta hydrolase [Alkalihalobacillus sp. LMS6]
MTEHIHVYKENKKEGPTFVLLHGTGGNEEDLLPLAEIIDPGANVLGVRGNVSENGMPRFFRRLQEGVFDMEDLKKRTDELHQFIKQAAQEYQFNDQEIYALGYSNGANIAANMMYEHGSVFKGAFLFHAMVPQEKNDRPTLTNTSVFIGAGKNDPMIPARETETLIQDLTDAGAAVESYWTSGGHQLLREELEAAKTWYEALKA